MKKYTFLFIIILVMMFVTPCLSTPTLMVNDFSISSWPSVSVDVIITEYLSDYDPEFGLLIDNKSYAPLSINRIENHGKPLNVLFLVDISLTMDDYFENSQNQMTEIANLFHPNDTFSMITFEDNIKTILKFSDNPALVGKEMGKQKAYGNYTKLYDAMITANELLKSRPENGIIFLLSDGIDEGSIQETPIKTDYPIIAIPPSVGISMNTDILTSISDGTEGFFVREFDINRIYPKIVEWKQIAGTRFDINFSGLPEYEPPITKDITFQAIINNDLPLEHKALLELEKPKRQWWIWIVAIIAILIAIALGILRMLRLKVPGGKRVRKNRLKGNIHYIAWLNLVGSNEGQMRIRKKVITIGSSPTCILHIDDPTVSALHAKITETSEGYVISDEDSASGVYVNEEAIIGKQLLKDTDKIRLGKAVIDFSQSDFAYVSSRKVI